MTIGGVSLPAPPRPRSGGASVAQGRIYRDLGFEQLALVEGWKSVNTHPGDYSGHRLLADSYSILQRHEIARVSELLQCTSSTTQYHPRATKSWRK